MTPSQIIRLRTDNGRDIVDFLVDVMQDRFKDFRICHRLQAARLLTTYGNEDAPDFIAGNTPDSRPSRTRTRSPRQTKFDTELARVIREDTGDGRSIARFLVDVMEGELRTFKPHHRIAAARELLNRGFGKSARKETTVPTVHPEPVEGPEPAEEHSSPLTPEIVPNSHSGEGRNPEAAIPVHSNPPIPNSETDILDTLTHTTPNHFEHTVLDLLEKMGYGHGRHTGRSGDGGIDGIIDQDTLGLDRLYVQAKRWTRKVGEPEIRSFSGSLDPHGATMGILITTSEFSERARRTARTISAGNKHIRLVDGRELAQLMIRHSVAVTTDTPPRPKAHPEPDEGLDENYFNQHT